MWGVVMFLLFCFYKKYIEPEITTPFIEGVNIWHGILIPLRIRFGVKWYYEHLPCVRYETFPDDNKYPLGDPSRRQHRDIPIYTWCRQWGHNMGDSNKRLLGFWTRNENGSDAYAVANWLTEKELARIDKYFDRVQNNYQYLLNHMVVDSILAKKVGPGCGLVQLIESKEASNGNGQIHTIKATVQNEKALQQQKW